MDNVVLSQITNSLVLGFSLVLYVFIYLFVCLFVSFGLFCFCLFCFHNFRPSEVKLSIVNAQIHE